MNCEVCYEECDSTTAGACDKCWKHVEKQFSELKKEFNKIRQRNKDREKNLILKMFGVHPDDKKEEKKENG